ncbi:MAG: hypothetical protein QF715_02185 [Pseudomonadales bacterium]|nr:hypothetical protein [Pseudomonadales bacterium]
MINEVVLCHGREDRWMRFDQPIDIVTRYQVLNLVPKRRDEDDLANGLA